MEALISIDYTFDFVAQEDALTTGKAGQTIKSTLVNLTKAFIDNGDYVIFAIDTHEPDDVYPPVHSLFPPHNIIDSIGRTLYGMIGILYQKHQHTNNVYYLPKRRYYAFCETDLDMRLGNAGSVKYIGVCTDICILHTAIDAYNIGYHIVVYENAVASFDLRGHT